MEKVSTQGGSVGKVRTQIARISLPPGGFRLECGGNLPELQVAYETYGELSPQKDNVVFLCHALTGDAHVAGEHESAEPSAAWWDEMVGPGKGIDTRYYHVICANILGGCKGTTGPCSPDPRTGRPYGSTFPRMTVGDIVEVHRLLLRHLGVERVAAVVGGSFGGMQVLEWGLRHPETVDRCICIASAARLSAQALAFDIVGRKAITADPDWQGGDYYGTGRSPDRGLAQAREIGHITYLSPEMMDRKFGRERRSDVPAARESEVKAPGSEYRSTFQVESYLDYQGLKFVKRFDANSYLRITQAMDEFDLVERHGSLEVAFAALKAKTLVVALSSDWLFPPEQSVEIANALLRDGKEVSYCKLQAPHGHDAFLVDIEHLSEVIRAFLPWVDGSGRALPMPQPAAGAKAGESAAGCFPAAGAGKIKPGRLRWRITRSARANDSEHREDFRRILSMIEPGSRVLDLGCGNGDLLTLLAHDRGISGVGVDFDIENVIEVIDRGHAIFQADIDAGLAMIPTGSYDCAILSETLQVVRKPRFVVREMLRVAREGIVSFPNYGKWTQRLRLMFSGRTLRDDSQAYEWYNTPNIHLFTLKDFVEMCQQDGIQVTDLACISHNGISRALSRAGFCNLAADRVLVKIAKRHGDAAGSCG